MRIEPLNVLGPNWSNLMFRCGNRAEISFAKAARPDLTGFRDEWHLLIGG